MNLLNISDFSNEIPSICLKKCKVSNYSHHHEKHENNTEKRQSDIRHIWTLITVTLYTLHNRV